jgi:hypothetical protein
MLSLQQNWRKGQNKFYLEARRVGERMRGRGAGGRNDPNNVRTYLYMNKERKKKEKKCPEFKNLKAPE